MLTKELVYSLADENITVKKQIEILSLINKKVDEIWKFILSSTERSLRWYSYSTDEHAYWNDGNGSDGGFFCLQYYSKNVELIGEFSTLANNFYDYNNGFPTEYLWIEDWKEKVLAHNKESELKQNEEDLKSNKKLIKKSLSKSKIISSIKSKLTEKEFLFIKNNAHLF